MKKLFEKFEATMMAAAFAEEGEFDTARQIMKEDRPRKGAGFSVSRLQCRPDGKELRVD